MRLAIIGDVHGCWTEADNIHFNQGYYDALLCVGDLPPLIGGIPTARRLSGLRIPAFMIPGNHDAVPAMQFLAELHHRALWAALLSLGQGWREFRLRRALAPVRLVGYSLDLLRWDGKPLGLVSARPYSMGGDRYYFRAYLRRRHGVGDFEQSAARLRALVDQAPADLIFLAHNGAAGLGSAADDIWGCDFRPEGGDFGDPDLRDAIDYARERGKRVHAVIAGHMHHQLKRSERTRRWQVQRGGVLYINAASVPRIVRRDGGCWHHHVALTLDAAGARAEAVWVVLPE